MKSNAINYNLLIGGGVALAGFLIYKSSSEQSAIDRQNAQALQMQQLQLLSNNNNNNNTPDKESSNPLMDIAGGLLKFLF